MSNYRCGSVRFCSRSAFTLIELLVVISIISLLVSILLPALSKSRIQGQTIQCASNLRQFAIGHLTYADEHKGWFPKNLHASLASIQLDAPGSYLSKYERWYGLSVDKYMLCPTLREQTVYLPQYSVGNGGSGRDYGLGLLTTYRIFTGRGSLYSSINSSYFTNGFYTLGNTSVHNAAGLPYAVPMANVNHAGRWEDNPNATASNPENQYFQPSRQPMAFDARNQHTPTSRWTPYAAANTYENMHAEQDGLNAVFVDGHSRWNSQDPNNYDSSDIRSYVGYWQGWHYFQP